MFKKIERGLIDTIVFGRYVTPTVESATLAFPPQLLEG